MRPATRQRLRLLGGTELSFITAGEVAVLETHAAAAVSLMLDFVRRTQAKAPGAV